MYIMCFVPGSISKPIDRVKLMNGDEGKTESYRFIGASDNSVILCYNVCKIDRPRGLAKIAEIGCLAQGAARSCERHF